MAKIPTDRQFKILEGKNTHWVMIATGKVGDPVLCQAFTEERDAHEMADRMNAAYPDGSLKYRAALIVWSEASRELLAADRAMEEWSR